jgi:hypothetical protein
VFWFWWSFALEGGGGAMEDAMVMMFYEDYAPMIIEWRKHAQLFDSTTIVLSHQTTH